MFDLSPERRRPQTRQAHVSAGLPIVMIQQIDDLSAVIGTNRSKIIYAALTAGLPIVADYVLKQDEKAAAAQQPTVKE